MTTLRTPQPDLQIDFYHRLQEIRQTHLLEALLATVGRLDVGQIDRQLSELVRGASLRRVASWGMRGEIVFAVPCILEASPSLLGYYRLLLGFSQKQFYGTRYGFGPFKSLEERGRLSAANAGAIGNLCAALCGSAEYLVKNVEGLSKEGVHELTLLTLGPQLRGGALNVLGSKASQRVFELIASLLADETVTIGERSLEVNNAAGRLVKVEFASDPDICIREELPSGRFRNLVAIEIKGGRDYSNIHNRIGEAEKSHQKARKQGFVECWTIVGVTDLDMNLARRESPTTDRFYHLDRITDADSEDGRDFRENLLSRVGIRA